MLTQPGKPPPGSAGPVDTASVETQTPLCAWQPLTFGGVAAFAQASFGRLLLAWLLAALSVGASVIWFVNVAWVPVVEASLPQLPNRSEIRGGKLDWRGPSPARLQDQSFLCVAADVDGQTPLGQTADVQLELRPGGLRISSLLGYVTVPYPKAPVISLSRLEAEAWWNAWKPVVLGGGGAVVSLGLLCSWVLLATFYAGPVRLLIFFGDRCGNWAASWRLAGAAVVPGALVMCAAIFLYGLQHIGLVGLLLAFPLHLAIGWLYLLCAPARLPRLQGVLAGAANPFAAASAGQPAGPPAAD